MVAKEVLRLFAGTRLIGFLQPDDVNSPRVHGRFEETEAFGEMRELFRQQNDAPSQEIRAQLDALDLRVVHPGGREDRLFTIIIDGARATWTWGFLRAIKVARHDSFWKILGDDVDPHKCREPDCSRQKISQSVFCKRHHFRMVMGEDYQGSLDDA